MNFLRPKCFLPFRRLFSSPSCASDINAFSSRTHTCGELRLRDVGQRVKLYGWLAHKRMNKFLVLRDAYGKVQAFAPKHLEPIVGTFTEESSLCLEGTVASRPAKDKNSQMPTGEVEIRVDRIDLLNSAAKTLPLFEHSTNENTRLAHRYLDLRWDRMQRALRLRAKIISKMRRYLEDQCGFIDVQTPTLGHYTPGGAKEFLVPANADGECFSLPQSPQIYKQLLMCGSVDRYYQFANCYRDEKLNPFRQPEFTQLDFELSFTDQQSVMSLVEQIVLHSWPDELPKPILPFPRLSYEEAMTKFGSDKPGSSNSMGNCGLADVNSRWTKASTVHCQRGGNKTEPSDFGQVGGKNFDYAAQTGIYHSIWPFIGEVREVCQNQRFTAFINF